MLEPEGEALQSEQAGWPSTGRDLAEQNRHVHPSGRAAGAVAAAQRTSASLVAILSPMPFSLPTANGYWEAGSTVSGMLLTWHYC